MEKNNQQERGRARRGFAAMNPEKQKESQLKADAQAINRELHTNGIQKKQERQGKKGGYHEEVIIVEKISLYCNG